MHGACKSDADTISLRKTLFAITPLNWTEWSAVLWFSAPVVLIDEVLKYISVSDFNHNGCMTYF